MVEEREHDITEAQRWGGRGSSGATTCKEGEGQ